MADLFLVRELTLLQVNDALRQILDVMNRMPPLGSLVLFPDGQTPPIGWRVADGTAGQPDLRAFAVGGYVYITRLL